MPGKEMKIENSRSRSRSKSRSDSYHKRKNSDSMSYERKRSNGKYDRYRRSSRSPIKRRYKKKTSRDNSSENTGNVVYISGLSRRVKDSEIKEKLEKYGKIIDCNVVRDPFTKESRGFGFFTFEKSGGAQDAIENLNKSEFDGRVISLEMSKRNKPHKPTPGAYLGPNSTKNRSTSRRSYSNERRGGRHYRSRSKSRSRSLKRERDYGRRKRNISTERSRSRDRDGRK